ncbi:MAG: hypothetical protein QXK06_00725 [Candidatus Diapherotrites archaeon]
MAKWKASEKKVALDNAKQKNKKALFLLAIQVLLALVFLFELYHVLHIDWEMRTISFSEDLSVYIVMALVVFTIFSISFVSKKRNWTFHSLDSGLHSLLKETTSAKIRRSRENPFSIALILIDFAYVMLIVMAVYLYLDPDPNLNNDWLLSWLSLLKKSGTDLPAPWDTIAKILTFAAITAVFLYMHNYALKFDSLDRHARKRKLAEKMQLAKRKK